MEFCLDRSSGFGVEALCKRWSTDDDDRRTTGEGLTPEHGYTIKSSYEPGGSGELN